MTALKWGLAVGALAALAFVILNKQASQETATPVPVMTSSEPTVETSPPKQAVDPNKTWVSIPKPVQIVKSERLEAKKALKRPTVNVEMAENRQPSTEKQPQETQIAPAVIESITETTGIAKEDIERAMTQESQ